MKKTILFTLIIALVAVLCSCNMDAQDGIYSAIASSTKESTTKVKSYLGYYDNCYYILTDESITRIGIGAVDFKSISAKGDIAVEAALLDDGSILVHRHNGGTIEKYDKDGKFALAYSDFAAINLMTNGTILGTSGGVKGLYNSEGNLIKEITNPRSVLESGDYTLVETTDGKMSIYKGSSLVSSGTVGSSSSYVTVGFEAVSDTEFYVLKEDAKVYSITASSFESLTEYAKISYTLASSKNYSFHYTDSDGVKYVVFKVSENFVKINLSDKTISTETLGYGSIRQNEVVNIMADYEDGQFIVATYSNYVWKIDPSDTSKDPVNIL